MRGFDTGVMRRGKIIGLALLVVLGACSVPRFGHAPPLQSGPSHQGQIGPTPIPRLPTVTPWPTATQAVAHAPGPPAQATPPPVASPAAATLPQATMPPPLALHTSLPPIHGVAAAIDTYMNELVAANYFSGAILVAHNGTMLISKGYGMANAEEGIPNTPRTRFRLASLTKPFTAMAVLILQDRGKLHVQDPICAYVPDCPATWQGITIHHLLSHTSGIPNYTDFVDFDTTEMLPTTLDQLINRFKYEPLLFEPGTLYSYSNSGYVLLGLIIERVSGQTYAEFLRTNIFEPLEMRQTGYDNHGGDTGDQAVGYVLVGQTADFIHPSTLYAAGALTSTVEDLYRWDQALSSEQLLPRQLLDEMFTPVLGTYGYGWHVATANDRRIVSHTGLINGFSNYIARYPDDHVTVIVLSNLQSSAPYVVGEYLAQFVLQAQGGS